MHICGRAGGKGMALGGIWENFFLGHLCAFMVVAFYEYVFLFYGCMSECLLGMKI